MVRPSRLFVAALGDLMIQVCRFSAIVALLLVFSATPLRGDEKTGDSESGDKTAQQETASDGDSAEGETSADAADHSADAADHGAGDSDHGDGDHDSGDHAATGEHGDGHGDSHDRMPPVLSADPGSAIINIAIFLGVFAFLAKFVWPVILNGLKAREEKIAGDLQQAQAANTEAQSILAQYQGKLDEASTQVQSMLAEARRDAEATKERIVQEAKDEAKRQTERAVADIETAKKVALSDLAGQTSQMAIGVAKQVVGRELNESDHADLIRKALDSVPSNN